VYNVVAGSLRARRCSAGNDNQRHRYGEQSGRRRGRPINDEVLFSTDAVVNSSEVLLPQVRSVSELASGASNWGLDAGDTLPTVTAGTVFTSSPGRTAMAPSPRAKRPTIPAPGRYESQGTSLCRR
jgi:hypothetical protein